MESVLEFIRVNYIWLLIIAVIILFALVGYIADKQGFTGNFNKKEKKIKPEKNDKDEKIVEIEKTPIVEEKLDTNETIEDNIVEEELEQIDETIDLENEKLEQVGNDEILDDEFEDSQEDLNIDQDFNKLLEDVEETSNEANIELPEDKPVELDEEDIWKF